MKQSITGFGFSLLCSLALFFYLTGFAEAASPASSVKVNGRVLDADTPYYCNDGSEGAYNSYNAWFEAETGTLHLRGLNIEARERNGIEAAGKLTVDLESGESNIRVWSDMYDLIPVYSGINADDLTITGANGSLIIGRGEGDYCGKGDDYGIRTSRLEMLGGTVMITSAYTGGVSATEVGIQGGLLIVDHGGSTGLRTARLTVYSGQLFAEGFGTGITAGDILIHGGIVSGTGTNSDGIGVSTRSSSSEVVVTGGRLTAAGEKYGLWADSVTVSGGTLTASGHYDNLRQKGGAVTSEPVIGSCGTYTIRAGKSDTENAVLAEGSPLTRYDYVEIRNTGSVFCHTPGEPVRENEVAATCTAEGSCDEVVYCTECNAELSRTPRTIEKIAHTPGKPVRENGKPATYTDRGSHQKVIYCSACGQELQRTDVRDGDPLLQILYAEDSHRVTIRGDVEQDTLVLAAFYREGRLLACMTPKELADISVDGSADCVKLFFLSEGHSPLCSHWQTDVEPTKE